MLGHSSQNQTAKEQKSYEIKKAILTKSFPKLWKGTRVVLLNVLVTIL